MGEVQCVTPAGAGPGRCPPSRTNHVGVSCGRFATLVLASAAVSVWHCGPAPAAMLAAPRGVPGGKLTSTLYGLVLAGSFAEATRHLHACPKARRAPRRASLSQRVELQSATLCRGVPAEPEPLCLLCRRARPCPCWATPPTGPQTSRPPQKRKAIRSLARIDCQASFSWALCECLCFLCRYLELTTLYPELQDYRVYHTQALFEVTFVHQNATTAEGRVL